MLRLLLVVTVVVPWLIMFPTHSDACDCDVPPTSERFTDATRVFTGVVTSTGGGGFGRIEFDVVTVWKGTHSPTTTVYTGDNTPDCSGYPFDVGVEYLVYEYEWRGVNSVGFCSGTGPVQFAETEMAELDVLLEEAQGGGAVETQTGQDAGFPYTGSGGLDGTSSSVLSAAFQTVVVAAVVAVMIGTTGIAVRRKGRNLETRSAR